jgi:hypothetical protein
MADDDLPAMVRRACEAALMYGDAAEAGAGTETIASVASAPYADALSVESWVLPPAVAEACRESPQMQAAVTEASASAAGYVGDSAGHVLGELVISLALAIDRLAQVTGRSRTEAVADLLGAIVGEH